MPEELSPPLPIFLDSTMVSTFRSCPRKFFWQYMHNLKPISSSIHLAAGGAFAAALEAARNLQSLTPETPTPHELLCEAAMKAFLSSWGECPDDENSPKNMHNVFNAVELYLHEFHPFYDEIQPLIIGGKPATEFSFALPLEINHPSGDPFIYVGRFDLLGKYKSNDLLVIMDDKTTGSLGSYWLKQWDMRGQFLGYLWACHKLGYNVNDVVVRGTGLLKTETNFLTIPLHYPLHLIQRWEQELYYTIEQMMFFSSRKHFPYSFGDACAAFGSCPMIDLCRNKTPSDWFSNYKVSIWNPVQHEEA